MLLVTLPSHLTTSINTKNYSYYFTWPPTGSLSRLLDTSNPPPLSPPHHHSPESMVMCGLTQTRLFLQAATDNDGFNGDALNRDGRACARIVFFFFFFVVPSVGVRRTRFPNLVLLRTTPSTLANAKKDCNLSSSTAVDSSGCEAGRHGGKWQSTSSPTNTRSLSSSSPSFHSSRH